MSSSSKTNDSESSWLNWASTALVSDPGPSNLLQKLTLVTELKTKVTADPSEDDCSLKPEQSVPKEDEETSSVENDCNCKYGIHEGKTSEQEFNEALVKRLTADVFLRHRPPKNEVITSLITRRPRFVRCLFDGWPLGFLRYSNSFLVVGPYLCLPEFQLDAIEKCREEQVPYAAVDDWEPMHPSSICDAQQLELYLKCFLKRFGPTWIKDVTFKYFVSSLADKWKNHNTFLMDTIVAIPDVIAIADTLYDLSLDDHRHMILLNEIVPGPK